jgi:hypothetical protein
LVSVLTSWFNIVQLSDYNLTSVVLCIKSAYSLTVPNTRGFLRELLTYEGMASIGLDSREMDENLYSYIYNLVQVSSCSNTGLIRDDPYRISRENSFIELIELSSINKVSLVYVSSCSNTGTIRDDFYWIYNTVRLSSLLY